MDVGWSEIGTLWGLDSGRWSLDLLFTVVVGRKTMEVVGCGGGWERGDGRVGDTVLGCMESGGSVG